MSSRVTMPSVGCQLRRPQAILTPNSQQPLLQDGFILPTGRSHPPYCSPPESLQSQHGHIFQGHAPQLEPIPQSQPQKKKRKVDEANVVSHMPDNQQLKLPASDEVMKRKQDGEVKEAEVETAASQMATWERMLLQPNSGNTSSQRATRESLPYKDFKSLPYKEEAVRARCGRSCQAVIS